MALMKRNVGVFHDPKRIPATILGACVASLALAGNIALAAEPCQSSCATLQVGSGIGQPNQTVSIPISFMQGPDDGESGSGNDDIAAIAFTLGAPGTGGTAPLTLPCVNSGDGSPNKLAPEAVQVAAAIDAAFRVVVENAECVNRDHCLCPGAGQQRDDYVNVVVYGPKDLPEQGPVEIPILPDGALMTLNFRVASGISPQAVALHVFSQTDNDNTNPVACTEDGDCAEGQRCVDGSCLRVKPQFGALASIGDQSAVDVTVDGATTDRSQIAFSDGEVTIERAVCVGDCNGDGVVAINELVTGVNIALDQAELASCASLDQNGNGSVEIDELIRAVGNALDGCP